MSTFFYENKRIGLLLHLVHFIENSPISVQCSNPGVTIVPSQPYTTDTPKTSTTLPLTTNTETPSVTSDVTSNVKSSTGTSTPSTESPGTTRTEFSQTTAKLTSDSTSSGDVLSSSVKNTGKVESTTGFDTGTTTPVKTSSAGKEDVPSVKKVINTADFNGTVTLNLLITILSSFHE